MDTPLKFSRRNPERKRRRTHVTIPERAGPHVKLVFAEMKRQNITYDEVEVGSGVLRTTVKAWRNKNYPSLMSIEAVMGSLGWDFVAVPRQRVLPKEVFLELWPIAERLGMTMPVAIEHLIAIAAGIHTRFPAEAPPPLDADPEPLVAAERNTTDCRAAALRG